MKIISVDLIQRVQVRVVMCVCSGEDGYSEKVAYECFV
jgi:hypothetical protein